MCSCTKQSSTPQSLEPFTMAPSTWVVYMYKDGTILNPINRSDTLVFTSKSNYSYNHIDGTYALNPDQTTFNLSLQNTVFGNISGSIQNNFEHGNIINAPFNTIPPSEQVFYLWMRRL